MDFHCLSRRELQALCKKNKIPANMTNVAMADALKTLEIVEGIEEHLKQMESETSQSSIESPVKSEETSPCVLRTGGRSTRRRNVVKEEPGTLPSRTTTRRSTRKAVAEDEGEKGVAIGTPALAATTRRRAQASLVRRNVETQFEEEEMGKETKTVPPTPAPLGTTNRRRVKEEDSTAKTVYSTRRSVRLAEKNVEISKGNEEEKLETLKQELFIKEMGDNVDMNLKQGTDDSNKHLEISGVDMKTMSGDHSEKMDNLDLVFEEEREENSEVEDPKFSMEGGENMENQLDLSIEIQENDGSQNMCITEVENALDNGESNSDKVLSCVDMEDDDIVDDALENKDDEISCDTKSQIERRKEMENVEDMDSEVFPGIVVDSWSYEVKTKLNVANLETSAADVGSNGHDIVGEESGIDLVKDVVSGLATEEESLGKILGDDPEADFKFIDHLTFPEQIDNVEELDSIEILEHKQSKQDADQVCIATEESLWEGSSDEAEASFVFIDHSTFHKKIGEKCDSIEILESEQSKQDCDQVAIDEAEASFVFIDHSTFHKKIGEKCDSIEILESEQSKQDCDQVAIDGAIDVPLSLSTLIPTADPTEGVQAYSMDVEPTQNYSLSFAGSDPDPVVQPTGFTAMKTPIKKTPSKTPTMMKKITDISDNKENHGSGSEFFIFTKEKVKTPSKTPTTKKKMTDVSDNKENLDSGKKMLILTKEKVMKAKGTATGHNLNDFSVRKLTKMLKEKLQITNESSKNENGTEAATVTSRPALQALRENQLVDEAQN
ncbi:Uncharacterized protein Adt_12704 [Abeliophyllum distichum]|uniref:Uncharacterized protein n=1 Tax=Abeliophyllum distichum TaxID=126358 RepID=A0ABD1URG5_9LAMI